MSHGKQFTLYSHKGGPNGWKVAFVLEELGLTYESVYLEFSKNEQKAPEFLKLCPNGRIPALVDHKNGDFVVWESNAIIQYIVDKYDTEHKISVAPGTDEYYTQLQWLYFQASGQGPYFGQAGWFMFYHQEKLPSAIERYRAEIKRVLGVLESVLSKQEYLVANRVTIADLSFVPWNIAAATRLLENFDFEKEFPATAKWHKALFERPAVKKAWAEREKVLAADQ
ncbi:glutathione S-transferase [Phanerochaete sordida]|uniref:glutathione transferase n=1 Tax=Phanerochaete sordida TaxID=48140 RepID=A0A9P3LEG2_9APHY|nr:glutathione S-transferase [Phanerochaete sordida]